MYLLHCIWSFCKLETNTVVLCVYLCFCFILLPDAHQNAPTELLKTTSVDPLQVPPTDLKAAPTNPPKTTSVDPLQVSPTDPLLTTPTLSGLNRQVIPHVRLDWQSVGHHLEVDPSVMKVIDDLYQDDVEKCCRTMFTRWLSHDEGTGGAPRLWRTVLKALKNVGYTSVVGDVERTLFEHQQLYQCSVLSMITSDPSQPHL